MWLTKKGSRIRLPRSSKFCGRNYFWMLVIFVLICSKPHLLAQPLDFHIQEGTSLSGQQHLHIITTNTTQNTAKASSKTTNLTGLIYVVEGTKFRAENLIQADIVYITSIAEAAKQQRLAKAKDEAPKNSKAQQEPTSPLPKLIHTATIQPPYSRTSPYGFSVFGQSCTKGIVIVNHRPTPPGSFSAPLTSSSFRLLIASSEPTITQGVINTFIPHTQDIRYSNRPPPVL